MPSVHQIRNALLADQVLLLSILVVYAREHVWSTIANSAEHQLQSVTAVYQDIIWSTIPVFLQFARYNFVLLV